MYQVTEKGACVLFAWLVGNCLLFMLLVQIESNSIIAAGAYLEENTVVPSGEVRHGLDSNFCDSLIGLICYSL